MIISVSDTVRELPLNDAEIIFDKLVKIQNYRPNTSGMTIDQKNVFSKLATILPKWHTQIDDLNVFDKMGIEMPFLVEHGDIHIAAQIINECGWKV